MEKKKTKYNWSVYKTKVDNPEIIERVKSLTQITFMPIGISKEPVFTCARLNIGHRFYIIKTKSLAWLEMELNKCLKTYAMSGLQKTNLFYPIIKYVYDKGYYEIQVDIICQSENAYNVIKSEHTALKDVEGDSKCLNPSFEPYTPIFNAKTGMFGWLTVNQFLNYKKFVKNQEAKIASQ